MRLFKYFSPKGAIGTLSTGTVRLTRPSRFNDPFDMRLDDALGVEIKQFLEEQKIVLFNFLCEGGENNILASRKLGAAAALLTEKMRTAAPEKKKFMREKLITMPVETIYDLAELERSRITIVECFTRDLSEVGVFCTTSRHDSLLMWAHYAQSHEGAVLQFAPDLERNSLLCRSKPVRYAQERALPFRTPTDLLKHALTMSSEESAEDIMDRLIFTKGQEWEYEQEFRLALRKFVPPDADFGTLNFAPCELDAVYLGCRIGLSDSQNVMKLARSLNPNVQLFRAKLSTREYALKFEPIGS